MFWVFPAHGDHILSHKPACSGAMQLENHKHQTLVSDPYDNRIILVLTKYKSVRRFSFLQNLQIEQISYKQMKCRKVSVSWGVDVFCSLHLALSTISETWQNHWSLQRALTDNRNDKKSFKFLNDKKSLEVLKITGHSWTVWFFPYTWDGCNGSFIKLYNQELNIFSCNLSQSSLGNKNTVNPKLLRWGKGSFFYFILLASIYKHWPDVAPALQKLKPGE